MDPEDLSSGEKQLLLLLLTILPLQSQSTVFLIDEPELSLNSSWLRQLINVLLRVIGDSPVEFIMATHSFELLAQHLDLAVNIRSGSN